MARRGRAGAVGAGEICAKHLQSKQDKSKWLGINIYESEGKVRIYVCCPEAAKEDPTLPAKLTDSQKLAKFIRRVLPDELAKMKAKYRWPDLPRVVVHDKASCMVSWTHERLSVIFAGALAGAGFTS